MPSACPLGPLEQDPSRERRIVLSTVAGGPGQSQHLIRPVLSPNALPSKQTYGIKQSVNSSVRKTPTLSFCQKHLLREESSAMLCSTLEPSRTKVSIPSSSARDGSWCLSRRLLMNISALKIESAFQIFQCILNLSPVGYVVAGDAIHKCGLGILEA